MDQLLHLTALFKEMYGVRSVVYWWKCLLLKCTEQRVQKCDFVLFMSPVWQYSDSSYSLLLSVLSASLLYLDYNSCLQLCFFHIGVFYNFSLLKNSQVIFLLLPNVFKVLMPTLLLLFTITYFPLYICISFP